MNNTINRFIILGVCINSRHFLLGIFIKKQMLLSTRDPVFTRKIEKVIESDGNYLDCCPTLNTINDNFRSYLLINRK